MNGEGFAYAHWHLFIYGRLGLKEDAFANKVRRSIWRDLQQRAFWRKQRASSLTKGRSA